MNPNLLFEFSTNRENNSIIVKREFQAKLSLVWDAWTNPELLDKWWAPKPWMSKTKSMEFKPGGRRHYAMIGPNGEIHWGLTNYHTIHIEKEFTGSDCFCDENATINSELPESKFITTFIDKADCTQVNIHTTYQSFEQLEASLKMGFEKGMTMAFEGLDHLLSSID